MEHIPRPPRRRSGDWLDGQAGLPLEEQVSNLRHRVAQLESAQLAVWDHLFGDERDRADHGVIGEMRASLRGNRRLLQTVVTLLATALLTGIADLIATHGHF